jgi:thymidylate synthase
MELQNNNMNILDDNYKQLLLDIIRNGVEKKDRTGTGTLSVFGRQIRHKMSEGFPILTTKKVAWKGVVSELLWFLTGQSNIAFLLKHNNHIWNGDAYKNYAAKTSMDVDGQLTKEEFIERIQTDNEFAKVWGDLGPIYGKQWRMYRYYHPKIYPEISQELHLGVKTIDQIDNLINELKTNPDSRRLMVSAWNPGELDQMVLPPCHYGFQIYTRELSHDERFEIYKKVCGRDLQPHISGINFKQFHFDEYSVPKRAISLMWNQRSVDTFLGLPFNIASYGLLLEIIAREVGMMPDEIIGNLGDVHLYKNHIEQAHEQIGRTSFVLPQLKTDAKMDGICCNVPDDFVLEGYQSHPAIKAPLSN